MSYGYNRAEFKSVKISGSLVALYCKFVSLELALKEELGGVSSQLNGGHDIPLLLNQLALTSTRAKVIAGRGKLNSLLVELRTKMGVINCQGRQGSCVKLPSKSYPYLRYIRHSSDNWVGANSTTAEIAALNTTVNKIIHALTTTGVLV